MQTKNEKMDWNKLRIKELLQMIFFLIEDGMETKKALDMTLSSSSIDEKYKQQIRNVFKLTQE